MDFLNHDRSAFKLSTTIIKSRSGILILPPFFLKKRTVDCCWSLYKQRHPSVECTAVKMSESLLCGCIVLCASSSTLKVWFPRCCGQCYFPSELFACAINLSLFNPTPLCSLTNCLCVLVPEPPCAALPFSPPVRVLILGFCLPHPHLIAWILSCVTSCLALEWKIFTFCLAPPLHLGPMLGLCDQYESNQKSYWINISWDKLNQWWNSGLSWDDTRQSPCCTCEDFLRVQRCNILHCPP